MLQSTTFPMINRETSFESAESTSERFVDSALVRGQTERRNRSGQLAKFQRRILRKKFFTKLDQGGMDRRR